MIDYKEMAIRVHIANEKWWRNPHTGEPQVQSLGRKLMLVVSELAECMEGARKGLQDDKLPHRKMEEVEMADFVIRLLDMMGAPHKQLSPPIKRGDLSEVLVDRVMNDTYDDLVQFMSVVMNKDDKAEILLEMVGMVCMLHRFPYINDFACLIRIAEKYCTKYGYDLWGAVEEKMEYNLNRPDHKIENRLKEGGKEW